MLLCNNTAFRAARLIKQPRLGDGGLPLRPARPILATMNEADELARRFLALWSDYLTALLSDPKAAEPLRRWLGLAAAAMPGLSAGEANQAGPARPPSDAAAAAGASGERDAVVAELARRVDELAERVAALESRARLHADRLHCQPARCRRCHGAGSFGRADRDPRLLHGRAAGPGTGAAPSGRYRLSRAACDTLGFSCRAAGASPAPGRIGAMVAGVSRWRRPVAGRGHPNAVSGARSVSRRTQIHPLRDARSGRRGGARLCRAGGLDQ